MPANLGMIALGKAKQLEKRLVKLELELEEIKKSVRAEDIHPVKAGEDKV